MDFRSAAPLERPEVADHSDTHTDNGRAQNARPVRMVRTLRLESYDAQRHYPLIASWWKARGSASLPAGVLPPTGSITMQGSTPVAACLVWLTNAQAAYLAFPVSAPELDARTAYRAVSLAIEGAIAIAREAGCQMIWATTASRGIDRLYGRAGLTRTSQQGNYFMLIGEGASPDMLTD